VCHFGALFVPLVLQVLLEEKCTTARVDYACEGSLINMNTNVGPLHVFGNPTAGWQSSKGFHCN
jgi:hypothetical protein